jgi:hypothetical protein
MTYDNIKNMVETNQKAMEDDIDKIEWKKNVTEENQVN